MKPRITEAQKENVLAMFNELCDIARTNSEKSHICIRCPFYSSNGCMKDDFSKEELKQEVVMHRKMITRLFEQAM